METSSAPVQRRVAVVGGGAIGCYMAAQAHAAGHAVTLCVRTPVDRLIIEFAGSVFEAPVTISADPKSQTAVDFVLLATKAHDTPGAASWLTHLTAPATVVVALQNGIDHQERIAQLIPGVSILPALVYIAVERIDAGKIVHRNGQQIVVPIGENGNKFKQLLSGTDIKVFQDPDFLTAAWRKLLSNLAANPITALTLQRMGVMRDADIQDLARGLLSEAVTVARAAGANIGPDDVQATLDLYTRFSDDGGTSMLYDRLAGRPLEHEHITGAVVRLSERHGIAAPLNRAVLALLRALNQSLQHDVDTSEIAG